MKTNQLLGQLDPKMPHIYHMNYDSKRQILWATQQFGRLTRFDKKGNAFMQTNKIGESYTSVMTKDFNHIITGGFNRCVFITRIKEDEKGEL